MQTRSSTKSPPQAPAAGRTHSLFFYGTLIHPQVLARVIGRAPSDVTVLPAVLKGYARLHVRGADYPAVISEAQAKEVLKRDELNESEASVRGSLATGLTEEDVRFLDSFEGDEYIRAPIKVSLYPPPTPPAAQEQDAEVYLWTAPLWRLEGRVWDFDDFLRGAAHRWVGKAGEASGEYGEVDRRRAMNGKIV